VTALSVCVIACNEEENLPRCLASVAFADDVVVVVDTRSRDRTEALASDAGARVFVHAYEGNVEQKNVALDHAAHDWVLALDADEAVSPALAAEIRAELARGPAAAGYELNRLTWHLGRWIRHGDFYPDWQLRLFSRTRGRWAGTNPHGRVRVDGPVARLAGDVEHYSYRDLADQVARIQEFSRVSAQAMFAQGRRARLYDWALRPPFDFLRAYVLKQGFRDGFPGFAIAAATGFHSFLKWAKLWELERVGPPAVVEAAGKAARAREA
jgi:glycosyltransferase involved in cell wall biosynthesis